MRLFHNLNIILKSQSIQYAWHHKYLLQDSVKGGPNASG